MDVGKVGEGEHGALTKVGQGVSCCKIRGERPITELPLALGDLPLSLSGEGGEPPPLAASRVRGGRGFAADPSPRTKMARVLSPRGERV
jgi:hypothetical protein